MKTETIDSMRERIKKLFEITAEDVTAIEANARRNEIIALAAFKKGQSSPKIKQLEWVKRTDSIIFTHHVFGITYCIYEDKEQWWIECQFYNDYECISIDCRDTLEEAKAAAQVDFEKRVMECLDL